MSSRITAQPRRHPSPGLVLGAAGLLTGVAALIVALTGTATGLPGKFRVDGNDLRPRVVKPFNIQRNAIRPYRLAPNTVGHLWLRPNTIAARAYAVINNDGTVRGAVCCCIAKGQHPVLEPGGRAGLDTAGEGP
jgi:hypothetical protein